MNKYDVVKVLAAYSPPLSPSQIEEAAQKIAELSAKEVDPAKERNQKARR